MKHLEIYFSKDGISSSQANHVSNLIRERNKVVASEIDTTGAYREILKKDGETFHIRNPRKVDLLTLSQQEGELYALSAWLREAIKAREALLTYYRNCPHTEFGQLPSWPNGAAPTMPVRVNITPPSKATDADILATFSVKDLAEYWTLEAKAAHIGKRIHKGGVVSNIREELLARKEDTTTFVQIDGKSHPVNFTSVYNLDEVTESFDKLQSLHRDYEKKLNWYKARIQNGMSELDAKRQGDYKAAYETAANQFNSDIEAYNGLVRLMNDSIVKQTAENEKARAEKLREVSAWKILIPDDLSEVYKQFSE